MKTIVKTIERTFTLNRNNKKILLEDINPDLSAEQIKDLYSTQYSELVNAIIINKGIENDKINYEFETIAGTKG